MKKFLVFVLGAVCACSDAKKDDASGSAEATTEFENVSDTRNNLFNTGFEVFNKGIQSMRAFEAATTFNIKLITVYLTEDIGDDQGNTGNTQFIWLNEECEEDVSHCDISGGDAEDGSEMDKIITSYFEFGGTSEEVNAAINSQARSIETGTYKYVRMEFCKYNAGNAENVQWGSTTSAGPNSFERNMCTVNSVEFDPPLEVAEGDSITVNLAYDVSQAVETGVSSGSGYDDCDGTTCFTLPQFVPTAAKK